MCCVCMHVCCEIIGSMSIHNQSQLSHITHQMDTMTKGAGLLCFDGKISPQKFPICQLIIVSISILTYFCQGKTVLPSNYQINDFHYNSPRVACLVANGATFHCINIQYIQYIICNCTLFHKSSQIR